MECRKKPKLSTGVREPRNAWTSDNGTKRYDSYKVLEQSAWIWRIAGIFPLTIKGPIGMQRFEIHKFFAVYSFFVSAACIGNYIYKDVITTSWISTTADPMVIVHLVIIGRASLLCMIAATIVRIFRHKEISTIFNKLLEIDLMLEKMNCCVKYKSNAKIVCAFVWTSSIIVTSLVIYDIWLCSLFNDRISIQYLFWSFPLIAQMLDLTIFVSLVGLIGSKFRAINKKLSGVVMRTNSSLPKVIVTSDVCAENLRKIAKAHSAICAVGKRLSSFFTWDLAINVSTMTAMLVQVGMFVFSAVSIKASLKLLGFHEFLHWELVLCILILIVVTICNWTSNQSIHTGKLIHEIQVEDVDSELYETLKTFSLQLHHQKLELTAGGFFSLDPKLIKTIVINIAAYLIIFIQMMAEVDSRFSDDYFDHDDDDYEDDE